MPQKNPTLSAQTQVLDRAHPSQRVGSGGSPALNNENKGNEPAKNAFFDRLEVISQRYEENWPLSEDLTQSERLQLSEMARLSLEDEIVLMRNGIKTFVKASKGVKDGEPYNEDLGKVLNLLGLSCFRFAGLLRVQLLLQGPQSAGLLEDLIDAMSDFVEKMTIAEEEQND